MYNSPSPANPLLPPSDSTPDESAAAPAPESVPVPPAKARRKDYLAQTQQPQSAIDPYKIRIPAENRNALGFDLMNQINQGIADRATFNVNLDYYEQLYEMHVEPRGGPDPTPSNVFIPLVPEVVDTMSARLASLLFQPRFFVVNGNTPQAAAVQAPVERYLNAELARNSWVDPLYLWVQQSLLYGNGILGVFWKRRTSMRKRVMYGPKMDEDTGLPIIDETTGKPKAFKQIVSEPMTEFDDVDLQVIPLKEFIVFPIWSKSIDEALAVARKVRLSEEELNAMVEAGVLWKDAVEYALNFNAQGMDERPEDQEGLVQVDADDQLNISGGTVNQSPYRRQRGPLECWQIHTKQYDMDGDGTFEENIFWVHEASSHALGYDAYAYWHGHRPYVAAIGMPRDQIFYGFAVPERLKTLQSEVNTKENQKNDAIDRAISPTLVHINGARCLSGDNKIGPDAEWEIEGVQSVQEAIGFLQHPEVPLSTWQEQQWLYERALSMMGLNAPMLGGQSSGRRTAREIQAQMSSAGIRIDLIANRIREALREAAYQIVQLKLQYGPEESSVTVVDQGVPQKLVLPKQYLAEDLNIDIAGAGGPLDRSSRAQDMMILYTLLMKNPLVMQNMVHVYNVTQMMLEEHNRPDVQALIGTQEDAQKMQEQIQAMQQQQAQMQQQQMQAQTQQRSGQAPQVQARVQQ